MMGASILLFLLLCCASLTEGTAQIGRQLSTVPPYNPGPDYAYFLSLEQRERGMGYLGSRKRLTAVINKLLDGDTIHITTVGGSITAGLHGVGDGHSWPDYLFKFLNVTFPGQLQSSNGAVPGTISSYMAACLNIHVPKTTDLVFVEYTVNDVHDVRPPFENEYRRAYERLLRKLLTYPKKPAVVLMHSYNWMNPPIARFWNNLEREYQEFAWYYDLPSLSLKAATYHLMVQGVEGYSVAQPRHDNVTDLAGKSFYFDKIHPDALTGARAMAELAMHLVVIVKRELEMQRVASGGSEGGEGAEVSSMPDVPPPMIPGNYECLEDRCFIGSLFQQTIVSAGEFEWLNDSSPRKPKFGFISYVVGSTLRIKVDTRASSIASAAAPQAQQVRQDQAEQVEGDEVDEGQEAVRQEDGNEATSHQARHLQRTVSRTRAGIIPKDHVLVQLVYLRSYEGMGTASVVCESGCQCDESMIQGLDVTQHNTQLYLHSFYVSQSKDCIIAVTVQPGPRGKTKVKVCGIIISEESGTIKGSHSTVRAVELVHSLTLQTNGTFDVRAKVVGRRPVGR